MRFVVVLVAFFLIVHYDAIASYNAQCTLLKDIDKKFSQGHSGPIVQYDGKSIILDKRGILHYYDAQLSKIGELDLSVYHAKISRVSLSPGYAVTIDNVFYAIKDTGNTGKVKWKKKFRAPIKGTSEVLNAKLAVLTADNYIYMLDATNGDLLWSYYNGSYDVRIGGLYCVMGSHSAPPLFTSVDDTSIIVVPFLNGELKAFNESGMILWSHKLFVDPINTPFTDITNIARLNSPNDNIIVTNKSGIAAVSLKSGDLLWSKPIQVHSINTDYKVIVTTEDDRILSMNQNDGEIRLDTKLPIHNGRYTISVYGDLYDNQVFIVSNKGVMFVFDVFSGNLTKVIHIPKNVYHSVVFSRDYLSTYFTTDKNGSYVCYHQYA